MKIKTSLLILVIILLASCVPVPTIEPTPTITKTLLPTETFTPEPTSTSVPTTTPIPTEIPMNPDWLDALNRAVGSETQFPRAEGSPLLCAIDVKSARSVNLMDQDKEILNIADCYYKDVNGETQVISAAIVWYDAAQDAVYELGSASPTKGRGKPGAGYIDNSLSTTAQVMAPQGKALIFMLMIPNPSADFLATGNPASFPTIGDAKYLVVTPSSAIALGW